MMKLAWRLFRRDWRSGELGMLFMALLLAVSLVGTLGFFVDRLQRAVEQRGATFLAGELVLRSTRSIDTQWLALARQHSLRSATVLEFVTMAIHGEAMQLVSVKAVDAHYPLLGKVTVASAGTTLEHELEHGPSPGEVWVDERALGMLGVAVGESIVIGESVLRVAATLVREPDAGANLIALGPRLMMNLQDVAASGVIQPGSRLQYSYLFAGEKRDRDLWRASIETQLQPGQRIVAPRDGTGRVASALSRTESFLLLGGSLGVVLAGVALTMAVHRYASRHVTHVVVLKTLGLTSSAIRRVYALNMVGLLLPAILSGLLLAWLMQSALFAVLAGLFVEATPPPGMRALWLGAGTGVLGLLGLAAPPLLALSASSPVGVLRQEPSPRAAPAIVYAAALLTLVVLLRWYSGDWLLTVLVIAVFLVAMALIGGINLVLLRRVRVTGGGARSVVGLALAGLRRHAVLNTLQILVMTVVLMLVLTMLALRLTLVDDWQRGLDPRAPNYFLLNVAPHQVAGVEAFLGARGVATAGMYPMVPGRIVSVDGAPPQLREGETLDLDRELNLTWSDALPPDNVLVEGRWWGKDALDEVSVEAEFARKLGLRVGSVLGLQAGGRHFDATISSLRSLDWDSMRPNFFLVFPRRLLESEAAMWLTSFHIDQAHAEVPRDLLHAFPTLTLIDVDALLAQLRDVTAQLARAISLVLVLLLLAAALVLVASVRAGFDARLHEAAIMRVLGATRRLVLGGVVGEFALLGLLAGLLAAAGAETLLWLLQTQLLDLAFRAHPLLWLAGPAMGSVLSALLGLLGCGSVVRVPPLVVLRTVA